MRIIVTIPFTAPQRQRLLAAAGGHDMVFLPAREATEDILAQADAVLGNPPAPLLAKADKLTWLQLSSAGADAYCVPGVLRGETVLTNASGAYDISVSENMVAATFALFKKLFPYHDNQKQQLWRDEGPVQSAYGACVLVLGLGSIGLSYARKMKAMGSYVIGIKRTACPPPEGVDEVHTVDDLEACLSRADVVAAVLPGTSETARMMGERQFAAMKPTAYFLNAGRGSSVDQDALFAALESGGIAGAALDVTDPEPLPPGHRLWTAKNLYLTPHVAGGLHIPITLERIADICTENLRRFTAGQPLMHVVDRAAGY